MMMAQPSMALTGAIPEEKEHARCLDLKVKGKGEREAAKWEVTGKQTFITHLLGPGAAKCTLHMLAPVCEGLSSWPLQALAQASGH